MVYEGRVVGIEVNFWCFNLYLRFSCYEFFMNDKVWTPWFIPYICFLFQYGGFSKFPGQLPDLYHTYYGFCAFSLLEEPDLKPIHVELGMTDIAATGFFL